LRDLWSACNKNAPRFYHIHENSVLVSESELSGSDHITKDGSVL
jgi:hypothetical protein